MEIIFLGTNGWYANKMGNTACALIKTPSRYIVLDAGDGIWRLDEFAKDDGKPIDIFLSHFHLDHIIGLHIQPKFHFKNKIRIFGQPGAKKILGAIIAHPYTASYEELKKNLGLDITVHELKDGENKIDEYIVHAAPLVHADPCWGFRFELKDANGKEKIISYCTDTGPCENVARLSKGADVLITECSLLPGEPIPASWPHLNPETAAKMAKDAKCKALYLTHFVANKYDTAEKRLMAQSGAKKIFENSHAAKDGMKIKI